MIKKAVITRAEIVSFGCLKKVLVTPSEGINLLSMPNESGKTTFASFVKFVLYGFTGTRLSATAENEKKRYMPWDGSNAEGTLEISLGESVYRITRTASASGKDKVSCRLLPADTEVFVGAVPGEKLFGVGEEIFSKTAFFRQLSLPQNGDAELASQLKNLSVGADEKLSANRAKSLLTDAKSELANKQKHGIYYDVKAKLDDTLRRFEAASEALASIEETDAKIKKCLATLADDDERLGKLECELKQIESFEAHRTLLRLADFDTAAEKCEAEYNEAVSGFDLSATDNGELFRRLSEKYNDYSHLKEEKSYCDRALAACEMKLAEKIRSSGMDNNKYSVAADLLAKRKKAKTLITAGALLAVIVIGLIPLFIGLSMMSAVKKQCAELGYDSVDALEKEYNAYPTLSEAVNELQKERASLAEKSETADANASYASKEIEGLLSACTQPDPSLSLLQQIEKARAVFEKAQSLFGKYKAASDARDRAYEGIDAQALSEQASRYDGTPPARDRKAVENEMAFCRRQKDMLTSRLSELKQSKAVLVSSSGDAALLKGKADALYERLQKITERGNALAIAINALNEADEHLKNAVAPMINSIAGEYFGLLTDGKYTALSTGTDLYLSADDGFSKRDCDALSAGARECAYISLRLALADVMYPNASVPVFLDDAFVHLDDKRLLNMLSLLGKMSSKHQIFMISCSKRISDAFASSGTDSAVMEIKQC